MPIPTPPTPYVRAKSFDVDDEPTFTSPTSPNYNPVTGIWTIGARLVHDKQLGYLAEAFEKLLLQNFENGVSETGSLHIDTAYAPDGVTVLNPTFDVFVDQVADAPTQFRIGSQIITIGLGWSIRTMIRVNMGIVVPPIYPPVP